MIEVHTHEYLICALCGGSEYIKPNEDKMICANCKIKETK